MRKTHPLTRRSFEGTYGKFEPNQPVDVPIWLAIELRKRNQCEIKLPPWMTLKELKEVVAKERTDMSSFQPLPFHYIEVRRSLPAAVLARLGTHTARTAGAQRSPSGRMLHWMHRCASLWGRCSAVCRHLPRHRLPSRTAH